jgi:serine/threonine protein kinase
MHVTAHEAAHKAGVLHRDISAGNIMIVDEGNPNIEHGMLIDWDHSKMVEPVTGARQHARAVSNLPKAVCLWRS